MREAQKGDPEGSFQLPFRDSAVFRMALPVIPLPFNSLFGIPTKRPASWNASRYAFNSLFGIRALNTWNSSLRGSFQLPFRDSFLHQLQDRPRLLGFQLPFRDSGGEEQRPRK